MVAFRLLWRFGMACKLADGLIMRSGLVLCRTAEVLYV